MGWEIGSFSTPIRSKAICRIGNCIELCGDLHISLARYTVNFRPVVLAAQGLPP